MHKDLFKFHLKPSRLRVPDNEIIWRNGCWTRIWHFDGAKMNLAICKGEQIFEWMNEDSWMRGQRTCPLTIYFNMWTVSSDVSTQRRNWQPLSVHLWAYCTHPAHDVNDVMCVGWPHHRGLRPLLFSNSGVGCFTSHKNQISISKHQISLPVLRRMPWSLYDICLPQTFAQI